MSNGRGNAFLEGAWPANVDYSVLVVRQPRSRNGMCDTLHPSSGVIYFTLLPTFMHMEIQRAKIA